MRYSSAGVWMLSVALVAAAVAGGCGGKRFQRHDIVLSMDPALIAQPGGAPTVVVDIIGVSEGDVAAWTNKSMTEYWRPGDSTRRDAAAITHTMNFSQGQTNAKTLSKGDPVWDKWNKPPKVFVLADLPGAQADRPGAEDGRRVILEMDNLWESEGVIELEVQRSMIRTKTNRKPEPKK